MDRELFRRLVQNYTRQAGIKQEALAGQLGLHRTVLSNKLNGTRGARLTRAEVKRIVTALAAAQAIATYAQAVELLAALDELPAIFSALEWAAPPLTRLDRDSPLATAGSSGPAPARRHNLPAVTTRLIGRERETTLVSSLLAGGDSRLVTLTGPGGTGKTRLSLAVAARTLDSFAGGCWFVPLAPLTDPLLVVPAIAAALGVKPSATGPLLAAVLDWLRDRTVLLVLDNFEQLLPAGAQLVNDLLAGAAGLTILVTSRTLLRVYGEYEFVVPSLALPDPRQLPDLPQVAAYSAVALFVARAGAVRGGFALTAANAPVVVELCSRVDGLPLAIELVAAQTRRFAPADLLARLEQRLPLPPGPVSARDPRHQTMRQAVAWSVDLLGPAERTVFNQFAVFVSGCSLRAASAVLETGDTTQALLEGLLTRSLLTQEALPDGELRFGMLETIREYAVEQAHTQADFAAVQQRHAAYFLAFAEEAEGYLTGPDQAQWLTCLSRDYTNLRAALTWTLEQEPKWALRLGAALWRFWYGRETMSEGRDWLLAALQVNPHVGPALRAAALNAAGNLVRVLADYPHAEALFTEGLALRRQIGDRAAIAGTLGNLGATAMYQGHYDQAMVSLEESLALSRELGINSLIPILGNLSMAAGLQGNHARAVELLEECLALSQQAGNTWSIANALMSLGEQQRELGHFAQAATALHESLTLWQTLGEQTGVAHTTGMLGRLAHDQGDYAQAQAAFSESLRLAQDVGDQFAVADSLQCLGMVMTALARPREAAYLYAAMDSLRQTTGNPLPPTGQQQYQADLRAIEAQLGTAHFAAAWAAGQPLTPTLALARLTPDPACTP